MNQNTSPLHDIAGIIFDCDGVLVDSKASNTHYYNLLRSLFHLPPMSEKDAAATHMLTNAQAIELAIPAALRPQLPTVAAHINYNRDVLPLLTPAPGLERCLDALQQRGIELGICTNRADSMIPLLEQFGMVHRFSQVMTAVNSRHKPDPDGLNRICESWGFARERLIFVGDSSIDQAAARNAALRFWAFGSPELEAERHLGSFDELRAFAEMPA